MYKILLLLFFLGIEEKANAWFFGKVVNWFKTKTTTESYAVDDRDTRMGPPNLLVPTPQTRRPDRMSKRDKLTLCVMIKELYEEVFLWVHQTLPIRDSYEASMAFHIGYIIGQIRERYRRMMEIYREMDNKEYHGDKHARTQLWPPGMRAPRLQFYIQIYEFIHEIELDIEKMIEMLENLPRRDLGLEPKMVVGNRSTKAAKSTTKKFRRRNFEEERYKSRLREQYLLRRMGLNDSLRTPKKRFQLGWPVEGSWDNLEYS